MFEIGNIEKCPRTDPIPDIPVNFPNLDNLYLDYLEIICKRKPGIPDTVVAKKRDPLIIKKPLIKKKKKHSSKEKVEDELEADEELEEDETDDLLETLGEDDELEDDEEEEEEYEEEEEEKTMTPEEEKEEYIWRFKLLKKSYSSPGANKSGVEIPSFNQHSDLETMKRTHMRVSRELALDESVNNYRTYLAAGFMLMEFCCKYFLSIDMDGFSFHQASQMHTYDKHLIELGENARNSWTENLPVEIKLMGLVLFQAGVFYAGKNMLGGQAGLFGAVTGQPPIPNNEEKKKKMRGPKMSTEDIKNMARD